MASVTESRDDAAIAAGLRVELAAAHRLAVMDDFHEGSWGHFSVSLPGSGSRMLITPSYTHWSRVTASSLVEAGPSQTREELDEQSWIAYRIHRPLHDRRPDAVCVLHAHPSHIVALAMTDELLNTAEQNALIFHGRISYTSEYDRLSGDDLSQGEYMADALGPDAVALILRNHGAVVVGATVAEAYTNLYLLDRACRAQILALSTGRPLRSVPPEQLDALRHDPDGLRAAADRHFAAMRAVLESDGSDYAA